MLHILFCIFAVSAAPISYFGLPFPEEDFTFAAALAQGTYCSNKTESGLKIGNAKLIESISYENDVQRVNIYRDPTFGISVAYEGTNSSVMANWAHDFKTEFVNTSGELGISQGAEVHAGIYEQFQRTWTSVRTALENITATYPNDSILVTGHSMGGGLCQLGALAIEKTFHKVSKAIAFAPARVGNELFVKDFDEVFKNGTTSRYTGVTNGLDWVPYGLASPDFGWRQPSGMVWIYPESSSNYYYFDDAESLEGPAGQKPTFYTSETLRAGVDQVVQNFQNGKALNEFVADFFNVFYWEAHEGVYMKTWMAAATGNCLPTLNSV